MVMYFVVLVTLAWLPQTTLSFNFTRKPEQPVVIVLNNNSTNVVFRWEFSLASGDIFSNLNFKRYEKDKGLVSVITLGFYQPGYTNVDTTLYSLHTNVSSGPSSGYVSFTIKDIMRQTNNKDGGTADARSIDYVYQLEMKMANILNAAVSDVEMRLLVQVHNFIGPKNKTINESEEFNVNCSADGKPSPSLTVVLPNGVEIKGTKTVGVNITAYRNMTGMYNCTAENEVTSTQTKTAWLNVWYKPDSVQIWLNQSRAKEENFAINIVVNEYDRFNLTCKSDANPAARYEWTVPDPSLFNQVNNQKLEFKRVTLNYSGVYICTAINKVGSTNSSYVNLSVNYGPFNRTYCSQHPTSVQEGENVTLNCEATTIPPSNFKWTYRTRTMKNQSIFLFGVNSSHHNREYVCSACNSLGCGTCKVFLDVTYIDPPKFPCYKTAVVSRDKETFTLNMTVDAHPDAEASCYSTSKNASLKKISKVGSITSFSLTITENDTARYTCSVKNEVGSKSTLLQVYQTRPSRWIEGHFKILNLTLADVNVSQLNGTVTNILENIYRCVSYVKEVHVEKFSSGSVVVDFKVLGIADINTTEYLRPVKDAVSENSLFLGRLQIDYTSIKSGYSPVIPISTTTITSSTATPAITYSNQPPAKSEVSIWIILVVVAVVLIILVLVPIVYYCKKKSGKKDDKEDKAGVILMDDNLSARNDQGIWPSDYADYGPSHTNPTFDHSVDTPKSSANNNSNQTKSGKEKEESAYAAVDYTKKKKNKNPEELTYAKLEEFQNKKPQPKGSHDDIVLAPQQKGENTRMPEKYQETIYADIVGTKKQGDDNQGDGATDASLNDLHKNDDETDKEKQPSDGNLGMTEEKEQKTVLKEKDNAIKPPVNQQVQPPTKEDTVETCSQNQPADSLLTTRERNETTLTTVSL